VTIDAVAMAPAVRAAALTDLNGLYSEAGRHGDAFRVAQEALVAIKPAAENDPGATMPTLVACASNLARCLRTRGRARDAVGVLEAMAENFDHSKMVPGSTTCRPWQACWTTLRCINLKPGTPSARSRDSHRGGCEISSACRR
jgi:hypothetical protein